MSDVVLTIGGRDAERVVLRGAGLHVADGEIVLLSGLDAQARRGVAARLSGRLKPRYGRLRRTGLGTAVLDAGDEPDRDTIAGAMGTADRRAATVILAGRRPSGAPAGLVHRELRLAGGELTPPPPTPPTVVHLTAARLRELTERALRAAGAEQSAAATVARVLVDAERRGHPSHGVALPPRFHASVRLAGIRPG